jgi:hypothetical protein
LIPKELLNGRILRKEGSMVLPRNKYTAIQDEKPKSPP